MPGYRAIQEAVSRGSTIADTGESIDMDTLTALGDWAWVMVPVAAHGEGCRRFTLRADGRAPVPAIGCSRGDGRWDIRMDDDKRDRKERKEHKHKDKDRDDDHRGHGRGRDKD